MDNECKIVMTDHGRGEVYLNGNLLHGVTGFDISVNTNDTNTLTLRINCPKLEVEGIYDVNTIESGSEEIRGT